MLQSHHCAKVAVVIVIWDRNLWHFLWILTLSARMFFHHKMWRWWWSSLLVYAVSISKGDVSREMYYCYDLEGKRKGMNIWWKSGGRHYPISQGQSFNFFFRFTDTEKNDQTEWSETKKLQLLSTTRQNKDTSLNAEVMSRLDNRKLLRNHCFLLHQGNKKLLLYLSDIS